MPNHDERDSLLGKPLVDSFKVIKKLSKGLDTNAFKKLSNYCGSLWEKAAKHK
jgi:hypothetical protein